VFLLDNKANIVCLKHIPNCFRYDRINKNVVGKVGGLNSIIKPSSNDLVNKVLLMAIRKPGRMTPFALYLVYIHFLHDPINGRLPYTSFELDLTQRIAFIKNKDDRRALDRGCKTYVAIERKTDG
jgi:hypothetical protein